MNFNFYYFLDTCYNLQQLSLPNLEPRQGLFVKAGVGTDSHHATTVWFIVSVKADAIISSSTHLQFTLVECQSQLVLLLHTHNG